MYIKIACKHCVKHQNALTEKIDRLKAVIDRYEMKDFKTYVNADKSREIIAVLEDMLLETKRQLREEKRNRSIVESLLREEVGRLSQVLVRAGIDDEGRRNAPPEVQDESDELNRVD